MEVRKIPKKTVTVIQPTNKFYVDKDKYQQKRVAAYCRVSTDSEEQLTSYNTQKKVYTEMILANREWSLAGVYADEGISGTLAKKRDEFNRMIKDCLDGKIDYIITKSVSRFARNTVECLEYVRMLKARGIGIIFEEQNIDTLKTDSELYLVIYAGFAQSESESMSKNITWAVRKNFEEGKVQYNYGRLIGYRKGEDGQPEIIPEEAEIIRSIFTMFLAGLTTRQICDKLLADGVETKCRKQKWSVSSVLRILRNEKYCGDAILQKTVTVDCISKTKKKNTGDAPMYYVHNCHEPIISREEFNRTQEELIKRNAIPLTAQKKKMTVQSRYSRYALSEIMHCGECGSKFRRCTWQRDGITRIVWRCTNRLENGLSYCKTSPTIEESELHAAIVRAVNRFYHEDSAAYKTLLKISLNEALGLCGSTEKINMLTSRIDALNGKMMDLVNETVASGESVDFKESEFKEISDEIEQLKAQIEAIQSVTEVEPDSEERIRRIAEKVESIQNGLTDYDDTVVRQMIECVRIYADGKTEVIFGGGYIIEEQITPSSSKRGRRKKEA
jgi:DNA invertase Pin-like site-specific DNA recombinase